MAIGSDARTDDAGLQWNSLLKLTAKQGLSGEDLERWEGPEAISGTVATMIKYDKPLPSHSTHNGMCPRPCERVCG